MAPRVCTSLHDLTLRVYATGGFAGLRACGGGAASEAGVAGHDQGLRHHTTSTQQVRVMPARGEGSGLFEGKRTRRAFDRCERVLTLSV